MIVEHEGDKIEVPEVALRKAEAAQRFLQELMDYMDSIPNLQWLEADGAHINFNITFDQKLKFKKKET